MKSHKFCCVRQNYITNTFSLLQHCRETGKTKINNTYLVDDRHAILMSMKSRDWFWCRRGHVTGIGWRHVNLITWLAGLGETSREFDHVTWWRHVNVITWLADVTWLAGLDDVTSIWSRDLLDLMTSRDLLDLMTSRDITWPDDVTWLAGLDDVTGHHVTGIGTWWSDEIWPRLTLKTWFRRRLLRIPFIAACFRDRARFVTSISSPAAAWGCSLKEKN